MMQQGEAERCALKLDFLKKMLGASICAALEDDDITEIMVNPDGYVWFESREHGMRKDSQISAFAAQNFLMQLARMRDQFLNVEQPYIETVLPFHRERIEGTIAPVTARASFTIRKPATVVYLLSDYVKQGILSSAHENYLCEALVSRKNILVSGGPGTGKTTFCNALIAKLAEVADSSQRVVMLEDTGELQCQMPNVLPMVTSSHISMTTLLKIAMRSRPDRIVVGEVRDGAALDLLKAWNTGCPGGLATIHANSPESSLLRLLSLAQEAGVPPPHSLVAETVDVVVNIVRDAHHPAGRVVRSVMELRGLNSTQFDCYPVE